MRILTGLQPSGKLHVGNYFGAVQPAVELQQAGETYYFIADYHALTSIADAASLRLYIRELAIDMLACGLDPQHTVFFCQSAVPEVHELAWLLSTICPMSWLNKCHSYKDKLAQGIAPNHALFAYPVLMAADILLYDAERVPIGKDQKQHLEVTRALAVRFNETFGSEILTVPEEIIREQTAVVPGLDGRKMSKSYHNTLPVFGEEQAVRKTIMRIVTDSTPIEAPKAIENSVILPLYRLFASAQDYQAMEDAHRQGGIGYGEFKKQLADAYWNYFAPMRARREELANTPGLIDDILADGAKRARARAQLTLERVRAATGLR